MTKAAAFALHPGEDFRILYADPAHCEKRRNIRQAQIKDVRSMTI